ncbi:MAG: biotin--[acetyl-CoA-carboxylase] ligase [Gemmatimonadales bacterium]
MAPPRHRFRQVTSTLDVLHELAAQGAPDGTVVIADEQSNGRGARGHTWHSPLGGLWLSILSRVGDSGAEVLSLRVGLSVADTLDGLGGLPKARLKWPNDIMLEDRKVGGILCEARWQGGSVAWIAIGVGLNVRNPVPAGLATPGTSLSVYRPELTPEVLIEPLAAGLGGGALAAKGPNLTPEELRAFDERDWLRGRLLLQPEPGRARGIGADGALRVERPEGAIVAVRTGHVVLAPAPSDSTALM